MLGKFKKTPQINDKQLSSVQEQIIEWSLPISANALLDGAIIKNISLSTNDTLVAHGLDRSYVGYIVIDRNANAVVYTSTSANPDATRFIVLKASASCVVSIYVF